MEKDKRLMEASWWESDCGKLGPVLMGGAILCKSLIQFSVDGWSCVPSLLFTWDQTMVEVMKIMESSFKRSQAWQEATVRARLRKTDWFQIGKRGHQGCILSPCSFNLNAQYIMQYARRSEAQAGIKTARRNISNLRYQMIPSLEQKAKRNCRASWWKSKMRVKSWLKTQHSKREDHGTQSHHFMSNRWGNSGNSGWLYFLGLQNHCRWWLQPWN